MIRALPIGIKKCQQYLHSCRDFIDQTRNTAFTQSSRLQATNWSQWEVSNISNVESLIIKPENMKISDFYKAHGMKCLVHYTCHFQNAVSILKTGNLAPYGSYQDQIAGVGHRADQKYVYFWPEHYENSPKSVQFHSSRYSVRDGVVSGSLNRISFVFDLNILDKYPFYTGSMHGILAKNSFSTDPDVKTGNPLSNSVLATEVLIRGKVSTESLVAIWIHESKKEYFLGEFKKHGIEKINGQLLSILINP